MSETQDGDQIIGVIPDTNLKIMNWHGFKVAVGRGYGPFFFNEIEGRRTQNRSNIILITGSPGEGKTYCALRLGEIFDPQFDVRQQVCFERQHLLRLIGNDSPLKRGQVIVVDESQYAMGSRRWYEQVQKDLMESIESVRSRGYIIIIVALHLNLLDVIIRKYVLSYMIHMEDRGLGIVYRLYTPRFESDMRRYRLCKLRLQLPDVDKCAYPDCLRCKYKDICMTSRAIYERRKKEFVGRRSKIAEERAEQKALRELNIRDEEIVEKLKEYEEEHVLTNRNTIDRAYIKVFTRTHFKINIGRDRCGDIQTLYRMKHGTRVSSEKIV